MLEDIFSFKNLYEAHKNCRKSKQHKGEVVRFEVSLATNLEKIRKEIITHKYKMGKYRMFLIYEPKKRVIEAPCYRDRIVIRCFCEQVLKPKIEKKLIYDNAACRKGKGTHFSINRLEIFDKIGTKAAITDYAIALGGFVDSNHFTKGGRVINIDDEGLRQLNCVQTFNHEVRYRGK
ncbi:MAG: hypothetical protein HFJ12_04480 [Bacilli bacterium]|nr:hypothetical protein [Bacilli bacterium]